MRIAILGTGSIGSALATLFARHGHEVWLGSREPGAAAALAARVGARGVVPYRQAVAASELTVLCVPWPHGLDVVASLSGELAGRIVIDASNPESADGRSLAVGHTTSGAEALAQRAPGAHLVKAFNGLYAELLGDRDALARLRPSVFLCGDSAPAKAKVTTLITSCALDAVDCGPLRVARHLEPLAMLMVQLVRGQGWGPAAIALRLAR
jgi:predicted dinucleotide-binding enzyme